MGRARVIEAVVTKESSTSKAINQWNVNFFTRLPSPYGSGKNGYDSIASFTPEETMFQLNVQHVKPIKTA
ncbi:MAG TPA: hypothetical protein VEE85_00390 [Candidatus Bathyarchaeia archaeon]|nr:hypothetical protein [Candidatus Bathyarchaeia archaeon]